jgi:hypothetical protein
MDPIDYFMGYSSECASGWSVWLVCRIFSDAAGPIAAVQANRVTPLKAVRVHNLRHAVSSARGPGHPASHDGRHLRTAKGHRRRCERPRDQPRAQPQAAHGTGDRSQGRGRGGCILRPDGAPAGRRLIYHRGHPVIPFGSTPIIEQLPQRGGVDSVVGSGTNPVLPMQSPSRVVYLVEPRGVEPLTS